MSTLAEYKVATLARPDVADIVKLEAVERIPVKSVVNGRQEVTGYQEVEHVMEGTGRKLKKYDVHLVKTRMVDGVEHKHFVTEGIAVYDQGTPGEEVVVVNSTVEKAARVATAIERYIRKLPYLNVEDIEVNAEAKTARFQALKDNGNNTANEVEVFVYGVKLPNTPIEYKHVEVIK